MSATEKEATIPAPAATSPSAPPRTTLVVGLSGPTSSGKSTLARLLRDIVNRDAAEADATNYGDGDGDGRSHKPKLRLEVLVLHEDDFYKPDDQIPTTTTPSGNSIVDWDCADAVDLPALAAALAHTRRTGVLLAGTGTVDRNPVGQLEGSDIPGEEGARRRRSVEEGLTAATEKVRRWLRERGERVGDQQEQGQGQGNEERARTAAALTTTTTTTATTITIIIVDGFLLFAPPPAPPSSTTTTPPTPPTLDHPLRAVDSLFDVKLFLPSTYSVIKRRRETRGGYATVGPAASGQQTSSEAGRQAEAAASGPPPTQHDHTNHASENAAAGGFWVDPPGYVDDVVWPAYVRDHAWLLLPPGDGDDAAGTCTGTTTSAGTGDISALLRRVGDGRFVRRDGGLAVAPGDGDGRVGMGQLVEWAVEQVLGGVERMLPRI